MTIDAHHHIWDLAVRDQDWISGEMRPVLGKNFSMEQWSAAAGPAGVDRSIIVQTVPDPAETPELLEIAAGNDAVAGVVGWLDTDPATIIARIEKIRSGPGADLWSGIRLMAEYGGDPDFLARADVGEAVRLAGGAGLSVDLLLRPAQLPAALTLIRANPDVRFVVDHLAKPDIAGGGHESWAGLIGRLAPYAHVACKVSGLVTEARSEWQPADLAPYVDTVLEAFGPDRLMFGSDWPVCLLAADYATVVAAARQLTAGLSDHESAQFWSGTASQWYTLEERS